ncbi:MAG: HAD hydrolase family protein [Candidatus Neomarinimicrobiota bacterium]|nr:HAD hydrolase family protein [Candidatus Neomarinimicrobiota bacterium]
MGYDINNIKMIISDVDGVWTDGSIYIGIKNSEFKKFNVNDGAGVALLRQSGIMLALISGRESSATALRAEELKIEDVYNGTLNKIPPYEELKSKYNLTDSEVAYLGDDLIDIPVMQKVGVPIATQNASAACKNAAVHVTQSSGGQGAFREAVEWILSEQGRLEEVIQSLRNKVLGP